MSQPEKQQQKQVTSQESSPMENQARKAFAFFMFVILFFIYKATVYDPYQGQLMKEQGAGANKDVAASQRSTGSVGGSSSQVASDGAPAPSGVAGELAEKAVDRPIIPTDDDIEKVGSIVVDTDDVQAKVSLLGGRLVSYQLKHYKKSREKDSENLDLVVRPDSATYPLGVYSGGADDRWVTYSLLEAPSSLRADQSLPLSGEDKKATLVLEGRFSDGRLVRKSFTFYGTGYLTDIKVLLSDSPGDKSPLQLEWPQEVDVESSSILDPYNVKGFTWFDGERAESKEYSDFPIEELQADEARQTEFGSVTWASMGDKYFMASFISPNETVSARAGFSSDHFSLLASGSDVSGDFRLFSGPKSYGALEDLGSGLERNIDFGWTGFVAAPLLLLLHVFYDFLGNYGVAIVVLTILVRAALYPLNSAAFRSMRAMQELQPEMKRIREKVKDKQQQQMEMMSLYKKKGVNPLGGCFPMLLQMPIFIGLYSALQLEVDLRHAPFAFWIKDLSAPEFLPVLGIGIPVMVILMVLSMLVQQWLTPTAGDPVQKKMMMIMPIVFGFMFASFPAGLTLYWLTSNLVSIAQQKPMRDGNDKLALKYTVAVALGLIVFSIMLAKIGN